MATTRSFGDMLNEYLNEDLIANEVIGRDYFLKKAKKDPNWVGGNYIVPFYGGLASSIAFGSLTDSTDISEDTDIRGSITTQPEMWATLLFNQKDLDQHEGIKREQSFIMNLTEKTLPRFISSVKQMLSVVLTGGPHFATATADGTVGGLITVDRPELFELKQKVIWANDTPANSIGYVQSINMETGVIHVQTTRAGGVDDDLSVMTIALNAKCYYDGLINAGTSLVQNNMTSMRSALLSAVNGGSAALHGQTKTSYPFLQAINASGAAIIATNIAEQIFYLYSTEIGKKAKNKATGAKPTDTLLSEKNYANVIISLDDQKGAFNVTPGSPTAESYSWETITVRSNQGKKLTFTNIPEMDDDIIPIVDWETIKFASNKFIRFRSNPDNPGKIKYYESRATTGFSYIVDAAVYGDAVYTNPNANGIIHSISY
jgi:hypothetical protein